MNCQYNSVFRPINEIRVNYGDQSVAQFPDSPDIFLMGSSRLKILICVTACQTSGP